MGGRRVGRRCGRRGERVSRSRRGGECLPSGSASEIELQEDSISLSRAQTRSYVFLRSPSLPCLPRASSLSVSHLLQSRFLSIWVSRSSSASPLLFSLLVHSLSLFSFSLPFTPGPSFIPSLLPVFAQLTRVSICFIKLRRAPFLSPPAASPFALSSLPFHSRRDISTIHSPSSTSIPRPSLYGATRGTFLSK